MNKFIVWAEDSNNDELWFLVDADSLDHAETLVLEEDNIVEIRASNEIIPNEEAGISHRFTVIE